MSKNVFSGLGFSKAKAAALQAGVTLAAEIERSPGVRPNFGKEWRVCLGG